MTLEWWMLGLLLATVVIAAVAWRARRQPLALQVLPEPTAEVGGVPVVLEGSDLAVEVSLVGRAQMQAVVDAEVLDESWWTGISESAALQVWSLTLPTASPGSHTVQLCAVSGRRRAQVDFEYRVVPLAVRGGTLEFAGQGSGSVNLTFWGMIEQPGDHLLELEFQPCAGHSVHLSHKPSFLAGEQEYRVSVERLVLEAQGVEGPFRLVGATLQPLGGGVLPTPLELDPWPEGAVL